MMATILDGMIYLAIFWLVILYLSSRINFQRLNILIAPLIIVWRTERFIGLLKKVSFSNRKGFWQKIGNGSSLIYLTLFVVIPLTLLINIFKALLDEPSQILGQNPISFIDTSVLIIIIPIFFALSAHEFAKMVMAMSTSISVYPSFFFNVPIRISVSIIYALSNLKHHPISQDFGI